MPACRLTKFILSKLTDETMASTIIEDLDYRYRRIRNKRKWIAKVIHLFNCGITILPLCIESLLGDISMIRNYLITTLRTIKRQKSFSFINITGLAIGITVCILIYLFVTYELGFDSQFPGADTIYRVVTHTQRPEGTEYDPGTPYPTAEAMRNDFPELKQAVSVTKDPNVLTAVGQNRYMEDDIFFVDPGFFDLLNVRSITGNPVQGMGQPNAVVLTESYAHKYFGGTDVIGKEITIEEEFNLHIVDVVPDAPGQTSFPYQILISWKTMETYKEGNVKQWDLINNNHQTFIQLPEQMDARSLEERFDGFEKKYMLPDYAEGWSFVLQPLRNIHFNPRYRSFTYITSHTVLFAFSAIGLLILIIACINFINLTTAQAMKRTREIGVRKVLGANRTQLVRQLLIETNIYTLISILLAVLCAHLLLPHLNQFLGNNTELHLNFCFQFIGFLLGIYLLVNVINGLYPSFILSRFQPAEALKERLSSARKSSSGRLRNGLVLFQFIISQILIVGTLVISGQMHYIANRDLGFRKYSILIVPTPEYDETISENLRTRWLSHPEIEDISFAWTSPTSQSNFSTPFIYEQAGAQYDFPIYVKMSDHKYPDVYHIPLLAGRFFDRKLNNESNPQYVINEATIRKMGLTDPQEAVGRMVNINDFDGEIIGVISDFHSHSLRNTIKPLVFINIWPRYHSEAQIRLKMQNPQSAIAYIKELWTEAYPDHVFEYHFLDETVDKLYKTERRLFQMIQTASVLAILIGCLGLIGLVSFMVTQRTKEIGIRKTLGASAARIYSLVSKEFLKWILLANVVAWPVTYLIVTKWLQNFSYRIDPGFLYFLTGGIISFLIALSVVSYQVIRAAGANPAESLRYE